MSAVATRSDDRVLVQALRLGDERAAEQLLESYGGAMKRFAAGLVGSAAVADEVVQETWIAVLRGIDRFEGRSSLKTWIFRILANRAKTRAEREGRTIPFSALRNPEGVPEPAVDADRFQDPEHPRFPGQWASPPTDWPEERLLGEETLQLIAAAIETLPPAQRAVITLRDVQGWSAEEVRNALELTETNQRVLLHRARSKVRRALEEYLSESQ